ncbi:hypothetical protein WMY93_027347 [Mugilogobius chulae]|uniref:G-protein coupled receptors family 1 profile domain-containing protein n=1 Tax=Mugilogobius chulae TaxID=88201 RepID=A0AAW0N4Z1_9GOBI
MTKQMLALSATYPESLAQYLTRYMIEPTFVRLNPSDMGLKGLKQYYKLVQSHPLPHKVFEEKVQHLLELFSKIPFNQALVFSNLHTRAQHLADILSSKGLPSVCISGGLSQDQRLEAMSKLKHYQCRVLISTDLTARGIDAEKVNLVINLDVPQDWETYMHRIGRAGRFGTQGLAVTYCCHGEEENKMMAIAQKCGLNLSALPPSLDPSLMEEACDWDICTDASNADVPAFTTVSKTEKKRRTHEMPEQKDKTSTATKRRGIQENSKHKRGNDGDPNLYPKTQSPKPFNRSPTVSHNLSLKEQQEALPKIPPLSSFKTCNSRFITFEEAQRDFQTFITKGLGRTVEVIRQFERRDEGSSEDVDGHTESFTLDDNSAKSAVVTSEYRNQIMSPTVSQSSESDMEEQYTAESLAQNDEKCFKTDLTPSKNSDNLCVVKPKKSFQTDTSLNYSSKLEKDGAKFIRRTDKAAVEDTHQNKFRKIPKEVRKHKHNNWSVIVKEEEEEEEDEDGCSIDPYWRMWQRSWDQYHPSQQYAYHSYYSAAQWMAALQTCNNALLVSLAVSDLLKCSVDTPLLLFTFLHYDKGAVPSVSVCTLQQFTYALCSCVQLLTLVSISVERFQAIAFPFQTDKRRVRVRVWITSIWAWGVFLALVSLMLSKKALFYMLCRPHMVWVNEGHVQYSDPFGPYVLVPVWTMSLIIIIIHYVRIFKVVKQHRKKVFSRGVQLKPTVSAHVWDLLRAPSHSGPFRSLPAVSSSSPCPPRRGVLLAPEEGGSGDSSEGAGSKGPEIVGAVCLLTPGAREQGKKQMEGRLAQRFGYIIIAFTLFWVPIVVVLLMHVFSWHDTTSTLLELETSAVVLTCVQAAVDPLIYTLVTRQFRSELRKILSSFSVCQIKSCI